MTPNTRQWKRQCVLLGMLVLSAAALSGCYERTVQAEGLGASGVRLQRPYVKSRWGKSDSDFKKMDVKRQNKSSKPW